MPAWSATDPYVLGYTDKPGPASVALSVFQDWMGYKTWFCVTDQHDLCGQIATPDVHALMGYPTVHVLCQCTCHLRSPHA